MKHIKFITYILFVIFILTACRHRDDSPLTTVFALKLGYDENNVGMKLSEHNLIDCGIDIIHRNNFFYITDKVNEKIMKFTERGELLLVIYNPDTNDVFAQHGLAEEAENAESGYISTKIYRSYPLIKPEKIEADSDRNIYVVDNNQEYKKVNDDKTVCDQLILKFDNEGNLAYKLGRTGIGNVPFGFISMLMTDNHDNLLVLESDDNGYALTKFDKDGQLIKRGVILSNAAPRQKSEEDYIVDVVSVKPSRFDDEIYITCQYIRENVESRLISRFETVYEKIYRYSFQNETFSKMIMTISPKYADLTKYGGGVKEMYSDPKKVMLPMEELVGMDGGHNRFFVRQSVSIPGMNNNNYSLSVYSPDGHEIFAKNVTYPLDIIYTSPVFVSDGGEAFSYYIKDEEIVIAEVK
ncbi:MAG: hypothetical protein IKQ61_05815 [Spirochaetales bacterium]|nr:hypothetical protein [Spirochaetales bacterium]